MGTLTCALGKASPIPELRGERGEYLLIHQILAGRRELFDDLVEPHLDAVWRAVRAKMGNDADVDDVAQQALFKAFIHLEQFRFEGVFRTWLIRIALNEVIQSWRKRFTSRSVMMEPSAIAAVSIADPKDSPFNLCARRQAAGLLQTAIATLPEQDQRVVRMRDFEERSISEVAEALRLTASAVKTRHHRARLKMAKILTELKTAAASRLTE